MIQDMETVELLTMLLRSSPDIAVIFVALVCWRAVKGSCDKHMIWMDSWRDWMAEVRPTVRIELVGEAEELAALRQRIAEIEASQR